MILENPNALPEAHRDIIANAIKAAFGSRRIEAVTAVEGGASGAFPYRVTTSGRPYLVRIEGPASPLRNPAQYVSMRIAADGGIAPEIYHINEPDRVVVMDFIAERSLHTFPGGPAALVLAVGDLLRRVQGTPCFPEFVEYPDIVGRLWAWVRRTNLFAPGVLDPHTECFDRICRDYAWDPTGCVSSHNDPVPRNILFDGERLWMIDWESAYRTDPLVDVAIVLDNFARSPALESALLRARFDCAPDRTLQKRLAQVRALTRLYYAGVLLSASAAAFGALGDSDLSVPTDQDFGLATRSGTLAPASPHAKHVMGKMYLASFLTGSLPPGLDAAV